MFRRRFSDKYSDQLDKEDDEYPEWSQKLIHFGVNSALRMVESALEQRNDSLATKYLTEADVKVRY